MSKDGLPEGVVTRVELAQLAGLFDQFEFAFDPRSMSAQKAASEFERRAQVLFEERVAPHHPGIPFVVFHARLRSACRLYLWRNPASSS